MEDGDLLGHDEDELAFMSEHCVKSRIRIQRRGVVEGNTRCRSQWKVTPSFRFNSLLCGETQYEQSRDSTCCECGHHFVLDFHSLSNFLDTVCPTGNCLDREGNYA